MPLFTLTARSSNWSAAALRDFTASTMRSSVGERPAAEAPNARHASAADSVVRMNGLTRSPFRRREERYSAPSSDPLGFHRDAYEGRYFMFLLPTISRMSVRLVLICMRLSSLPTTLLLVASNFADNPSYAAQFLYSTMRIMLKSS